LRLYYIATKFSYTTLFFLILFLKDSYNLSQSAKYFFVFLGLLYLGINFSYYYFGKSLQQNLKLRILDYVSLIPLFLLSKDLYGLIPSTIILAAYSTLYWKEIALLTATLIGILILNLSFFGNLIPIDFAIAVFYTISVVLVSSKLNLVGLFRDYESKLSEKKRTIWKLQSEVANANRKLRIYEETLDVLENFYTRKRDKKLDSILQNLLDAEKVLIVSPRSRDKIPPEEIEGCIALPERNFVIYIKPKEKYLEKDPRYRRKLEILVKVIKPYIETFLAKSK
jgi:hypothetical protein